MTKTKKAAAIAATVLIVIAAVAVPSALYAAGIIDYAEPVENDGLYLMCYFTGNEPQEERLFFAVSENGYDYSPLNGGSPVLISETGTGSVRDPYLFRDRDGTYRILATDLKSEDGWASNHCLISWESSDLIHWSDPVLIDMNDYGLPHTVRAWAPQAIWDPSAGKYMIYWANCRNDPDTGWTDTVLWYAYTDDFVSLSSEPRILFAPSNGNDAIDGDVVEKDGVYYLYYKDEKDCTIYYATASSPAGPYTEPDDPCVSSFLSDVEGSFVYRLEGTDTYVMMMDMYGKHKFVMQQSTDLTDFKRLKSSDYSLDFSPRHGSVLAIDRGTYDALLAAFPS